MLLKSGVALGVLAGSAAGLSAATALVPGDIVVALGYNDGSTPTLAEFTPAGTLVEKFSIAPLGTGVSVNDIGGITVGTNLQPYVYDGANPSTLWTINPVTGVSSHTTFNGWTNVGSTVVGGLTSYHQYIYATDENAGSDNGLAGIIQFDTSSGTAQRLFYPNPVSSFGNTSYDKVTVGYNGKLYALQDNGGFSSPYLITANASNGTSFTQVTLPESANAIAADASGDLYVLRGDNGIGEGIDEYSPTYQLLRSYNFATGAMSSVPSNLELSPTGNIVATSSGGTVLLTTTAFTSYTTFDAGAGEDANGVERAQAAFVQDPVPEPSTLAVATGGALLLGRRGRHRRRF